jgi:hypothetical protein
LREKFDIVSQCLNTIEVEITKNKEEEGSSDIGKIGLALGKATAHFIDISEMLEIYGRSKQNE